MEELACSLGIRIVETELRERGRYYHDKRLILLRKDMACFQKRATLLHELIHAIRGDNGTQTPKIERAINLQVARTLIDEEEFNTASAEYSSNINAIAAILTQPIWLVEAYVGGKQ